MELSAQTSTTKQRKEALDVLLLSTNEAATYLGVSC
jgi:hypothetical protein